MMTIPKPLMAALVLTIALGTCCPSWSNPTQPVSYLALPLSSGVITAEDAAPTNRTFQPPLPENDLLFMAESLTLPAVLSEQDLPPCYFEEQQQTATADAMPPLRVISSR